MDTNKIKKIVRVIERSNALVVGESPLLMHAQTYEATGDPHNEVIMANWHDEEGYEHSYHFQECAVDNAEVKDNTINVRDETGEEILIQVFRLAPVDVTKEMAD
jgi:hypothetical protein